MSVKWQDGILCCFQKDSSDVWKFPVNLNLIVSSFSSTFLIWYVKSKAVLRNHWNSLSIIEFTYRARYSFLLNSYKDLWIWMLPKLLKPCMNSSCLESFQYAFSFIMVINNIFSKIQNMNILSYLCKKNFFCEIPQLF